MKDSQKLFFKFLKISSNTDFNALIQYWKILALFGNSFHLEHLNCLEMGICGVVTKCYIVDFIFVSLLFVIRLLNFQITPLYCKSM